MKQLALILVLALLICACGCQPASLSGGGESTEPSASDPIETVTDPSEDVLATEPPETDLATEPSEEALATDYLTLFEGLGYYGEPDENGEVPEIGVLRSAEDCDAWMLELLETKVEAYSEDYFDDHSVVLICYKAGSIDDTIRVVDVSETGEGGYLFNLEEILPSMWRNESSALLVVVAVNKVITVDDIQVELTYIQEEAEC